MSFEEYLASKKIDSSAYKTSDPEQWSAFETIFEQMHPKSFTLQKLNLINGIRRRFPLAVSEPTQEIAKSKIAKPIMKPKTQPRTKASANISQKPIVSPNISAAKPKMAKPVMKPKMVRPVIKPKPKDPTE